MRRWFVESAKLIANVAVDPMMYHLTLLAPNIAEAAKAGQFVTVTIADRHILLPRPFDIGFADEASGRIELVYRIKGRGTKALSRLVAGDQLDVQGPFGKSVEPILKGISRMAVVGRGAGISPLTFVGCYARSSGILVTAYLSARKPVLLTPFDRLSKVATVVTHTDVQEPGGLVTSHLERDLASVHMDIVFTVGSRRLAKSVLNLSHRYNFRVYGFAESHMGCGFGYCKSCAVPMKSGYALACVEGPVIDLKEVSDAYWQSVPA